MAALAYDKESSALLTTSLPQAAWSDPSLYLSPHYKGCFLAHVPAISGMTSLLSFSATSAK